MLTSQKQRLNFQREKRALKQRKRKQTPELLARFRPNRHIARLGNGAPRVAILITHAKAFLHREDFENQ